MASLFRRAKATGMTVCADMVPSRAGAGLEDIAEALGCVEYFFPNADEAVELTGADDERRAAAVLSGSTSPTSRGGASGGGESSSSLLSTSADGTMLLARQDSEKLEMCAIFLAVLLSRTKVPLPCRLISRPCWQSSSMARRIMIRLTP